MTGKALIATCSAAAVAGVVGLGLFVVPRPLWATMINPSRSLDATSTSSRGSVTVSGKTVLITGASSGLGLATAKLLASQGANVVVARLPGGGRPGDVSDETIKDSVGKPRLLAILDLDLGDFSSIRSCVSSYSSRRLPPIDILILNAGLVAMTLIPTKQGLESTVGCNYVGHYVLLGSLLAAGLIRLDGGSGPSRIIAIASEAHRIAPQLDSRDLLTVRTVRLGSALLEYGVSKLYVIAMMSELQRRLLSAGSNVVCFCLCPGGMSTNIVPRQGIPKSLYFTTRPLLSVFFKSPAKAAEYVQRLATVDVDVDVVKAVNRCLYFHFGNDKVSREDANDPELGKQLWEVTKKLVQDLDSGWRPQIKASL